MIKREVLLEFQDDLRGGMTIEEACQKHGVSFREAVIHMPPRPRPPGKKKHYKYPQKTVAKHIVFRNGRFHLNRYIKRKSVAFGIYYSLEDAVKVRDYCDEHGWKQRKIDEYCRVLGVVRAQSQRSKVRYH